MAISATCTASAALFTASAGLELASLEGTAVFAIKFLVIAGHYGNFQIFKGALRQY